MSKSKLAIRLLGSGAVALTGTAGVAQAQDVAGFYGGVGLSYPSGEVDSPWGDSYPIASGGLGSMFAGYNMVSAGGLVYGGELSIIPSGGEVGDYYIDHINQMLDIRGRLGKVFGSTLVYGALGYSVGSFDSSFGTEMAKVDGFNVGVGFETPISENGFIGGDVTHRNLGPRGENEFGDPSSNYVDSFNMTTISVRLGFRF